MLEWLVVFWVVLNGIPGTSPSKVTISSGGGADPHDCQLYAQEYAQDWADKHPGWLLLLDDDHQVACVERRGI